MQLSETVKLYMSKEQKSIIAATMAEYINTVNGLVSDAVNGISISKYTSADLEAKIEDLDSTISSELELKATKSP